MRRPILLAFVLASTGCAISAGQTARTNGEGNVQFGVEPGVLGASTGGFVGVAPALNLAVRYGVSDTVDLGGRLGTNGLEFQTKFQVTGDDGVIVSPAPSLEVWFLSIGGVGGGFVGVPLPLLIDVPVGESALVIGPRVHPRFLFGGGGGATASSLSMSAGSTLGFAAKVSDGVKIFPEFGFEIPLFATASGTTTTTTTGTGTGTGTTTTTTSTAGSGVGGMIFDFRVNILIGKTK
ncbi:MAG: hypothetical protein ACI8PZ_000907 [Myxococcota bacterium]|jgi:hypothetical protein